MTQLEEGCFLVDRKSTVPAGMSLGVLVALKDPADGLSCSKYVLDHVFFGCVFIPALMDTGNKSPEIRY